MFEAINGLLGFIRNLLQMYPNQDDAGNMISDNSGFAALTTFQSGQLFGFAVKLLDLPTKATHLLYGLRVVLRHVVGDNIVRALGRKHNPEKFHFMTTWKSFDLDCFAMLFLSFCLFESIHSLIRLGTARIVHLPIIFEWTVVDFPVPFNAQHDFFGRIPTVHQHSPELQLLLVNTIQKHLLHMIQFVLAISVWIKDAIVNNPKLIQFRVDIYTGDDPYSFDDIMYISAVLTPHQLNLMREILVRHRVIEDDKPLGRLYNLILNSFPNQFRTQFFSTQVAVQGIMAELLAVVSKIRQRVIDLADQKILE